MAIQTHPSIELKNSAYVPIIKDATVYYGGSQMWFPANRWFGKDYKLHNYGCGTIAVADLFLYLAIQNEAFRNPITEAVLQGSESAYYMDYMDYVRKIDGYYTKTKRWLAVLGPKAATAINDYSRMYGLRLLAKWKWKLTYYDMLEAMEGMLSYDLPVILSIGPNTPNLCGNKGISFYQLCEEDTFKPVKQTINSHYVTVSGIIKDSLASRIMLQISSWGRKYFINYEEYRDYVNDCGGTYTSSLIYIRRKD